MEQKIMYTLTEAAKLTGLSYHFWYKACKEHKIKYIKSGTRYLLHIDNINKYLRGD